MPNFTCKYCFQTLAVGESHGLAQCTECNETQSVPISSNPQVASLYERALNFLKNGDYGAAEVMGKKIALEDGNEPEGYWLSALAHYGVSFVADENGAFQPVVHREQPEPFNQYGYYLQALEKANHQQQEHFRALGERINDHHQALCYVEALRLEEDDTSASLDKALALYKSLGEYEDASARAGLLQQKKEEQSQAHRRRSALAPILAIGAVAVALIVTLTIQVGIPASKYYEAKSLSEQGNYAEAITAFQSLNGFWDSADQITQVRQKRAQESWANPQVGSIVYLGTYEQDYNALNGNEDIAWRVLDIEDGRVLLISLYALSAQAFNDSTDKGNDWEGSDLQKWLCGEFESSAFSSDDTALFKSELFLLTPDQADYYFTDNDDRICYATPYAQKQGVLANEFWACRWWLGSSNDLYGNGSVVNPHGAITQDGARIYDERGGVRPAVWVSCSGAKASDGLAANKPASNTSSEAAAETTTNYNDVLAAKAQAVPTGTLDALDQIVDTNMNYGVYKYSSNLVEEDGQRTLHLTLLNRTDSNIGSFTLYLVGIDAQGSIVPLSSSLEYVNESASGAQGAIQKLSYAYKFTYSETIILPVENINANVSDFKMIAVTYESMGAQMDNPVVDAWVAAVGALS